MDALEKLKDDTLLIIFTCAPAGLGHLRVANALYRGLPKEADPVLLGSTDHAIRDFHRFISIHPLFKNLMEQFQNGWLEDLFTMIYCRILRSRTEDLYTQLSLLIEQRIQPVKKVLVVSTHFGLAHQLSAIKAKLAQDKGVEIKLVVQITDDTDHHLWFIPGADKIFVASRFRQSRIENYAQKIGQPVAVDQLAYPITPDFLAKYPPDLFKKRQIQANPSHHPKIHISLPISGAAVGTNFYKTIIQNLCRTYPDFIFHVSSRQAPYTQSFLAEIKDLPCVKLYVSEDEREVVNLYEEVYLKNIIGFEIVKPSEHAFKALLKPQRIGGAILLFTEPVGKQEKDNLAFLARHKLIPTLEENQLLWEVALKKQPFNQKMMANWRGMQLPKDAAQSANLIYWALQEGLFSQMMNYAPPVEFDPEVNPDGVKEFWEKVSRLI